MATLVMFVFLCFSCFFKDLFLMGLQVGNDVARGLPGMMIVCVQ
jgi:hypothetical protein